MEFGKNVGTPLKKESYASCKSLLESIESDPNAEPFLEPVRWEGKYNLKDPLINSSFILYRAGTSGLPADH